MKCDSKTLLKIVAGLGIVLAAAYLLPHAAREFAFAGLPFLAVLLCPLSMFFMMKSMHADDAAKAKPDGAKPESDVIDIGPGKA